ncbi:DNA polymerase-4 [Nitrosomonas sp. Nm51]|uniref:DNA polymerase IV n=1 Tax=Nitrosomonas sp. Nm51 TaxID=133720 RepID=UPI0008BF0F9F|nr:DNA polymerase IV [Nitrosomonas sp. Nm51]SER72991.1 DNA polymerase-4 [Nitrosomonas sp. Nm51]
MPATNQVPAALRRIAHLDMDAFYASVELLRYPELTGLPVVIGGRSEHKPLLQTDGNRRFHTLRDYTGRGVITTATYEARAAGVHSAMGVMKAARLAPNAVLLPADFDRYRHYSRLFKEAVARIAPEIENAGIDEIYIDLNGLSDDSLLLARKIKQAVFKVTGLTCSIGIAPNKLLAKICSDLDKPDGITIIGMDDIADKVWPLPVQKINGIGPKATQKLTALGITTISELAKATPGFLQTHFSRSYAAWLQDVSYGIDHCPVKTFSHPKSISRETTFEQDLHPRHDRSALSEVFTALCKRIAEDLRRKGYVGRTIGIKLRFEDFKTVTRDSTLPAHTNDPATIRYAATECLRRVTLVKKLRLLGVRVSTLTSADSVQESEIPRQDELPLIL